MLASWFNHVRRHWRGYLTLCVTLPLMLFPVLPNSEPGPHLQDVLQRDFISVHTRNTPTTYYEGRQGPTGFEYELMRRFADHLNVSLALNDDHNTTNVLGAVRQQGDMGAAALPLDPGREGVIFSRPIMPLQPLLVYRRGLPPPSGIEDLPGLEIGTLSGTGTDTVMRELQAEYPELSWKESSDMEVASLLSQVANGDLDAAVVFEHQFRLNRLFFPEVEDGFRFGKPLSLAWAFPAGQGLGLVREANRFLADMQDNGLLQRLETRYFGRDNYLEYVGARTFISHAQKRLPDYAQLFRQSARDTGFDWKLLAAVGYQESHWNPEATSPTGVRGLMMLTRPTASDLGVDNRLDPAQSIDGGARYLRSLEQRLPESITGDDRLYMALAAYNVGLGHLYDARDITRQRGGDPDVWGDVRRSLPLLQESGWYEKTRHGYARGGEPVIYVRNIRRYHEILAYVDRSQEQFHPLNARLPREASRETFNVIPPST
ncbi:membrane-bound lytic murein transglycosylase MltF [Halomonas eurihalina]|uniref:Membrane-bound lytic murein transglycosylase F n=1 Tax=Halomonas eurihalina TaxID=42566 RepID=A0A5D9D9D9_HALER|nr:membrane-bound lytic murein transglycosylase MltF [Halomonas eurihalina]MDR5860670.1 membrane-bound lytic murein transglycosylase MltF [Halomonas eurihalina]TZG40239.1 membrane-bound lytic murein transglycosylase MltF [Halomonas eurihalina]